MGYNSYCTEPDSKCICAALGVLGHIWWFLHSKIAKPMTMKLCCIMLLSRVIRSKGWGSFKTYEGLRKMQQDPINLFTYNTHINIWSSSPFVPCGKTHIKYTAAIGSLVKEQISFYLCRTIREASFQHCKIMWLFFLHL